MTTKEKNRLGYLLVILVLAAVSLILDQLGFLGGDPTTPARTNVTEASTRARGSTRHSNRRSAQQPEKRATVEQQAIYRPLPLQALKHPGRRATAPERNIFVYYIPPPTPIVPVTPDPPPLSINSVEPTQVFAGTGDFSLAVSGLEFPRDAIIFVNGQALKTTLVSDSELTAMVEKSLIASPGNLRVEVKNRTGDLYSNTRSILIQEPKKPPYTFIGRIDNMVFLKKGESERLNVKVGETVEDQWRVSDVGGGKVVLQDVAIGIEHAIELVDPAPISAASRRRRPTRRRTTPRTTINRQRSNRSRVQPQRQPENRTAPRSNANRWRVNPAKQPRGQNSQFQPTVPRSNADRWRVNPAQRQPQQRPTNQNRRRRP